MTNDEWGRWTRQGREERRGKGGRNAGMPENRNPGHPNGQANGTANCRTGKDLRRFLLPALRATPLPGGKEGHQPQGGIMYPRGAFGNDYHGRGKKQGRCKGGAEGLRQGDSGAIKTAPRRRGRTGRGEGRNGGPGVLTTPPRGGLNHSYSRTISSALPSPPGASGVLRAAMPAPRLVSTPSLEPSRTRLGILRAFRSVRHSPISPGFVRSVKLCSFLSAELARSAPGIRSVSC